MIDKKLVPVAGLKKEPFSGSHYGMRYYMQADESKEAFTATIYPEPWCFESTPEESKEACCFPLTEQGIDMAIEWLFSSYEKKKAFWQEADKNAMHFVYQKD